MKSPFSNRNKSPVHAARRLRAACLCAALLGHSAQSVRADVTNLIAVADTTLQDDPTLANLNYGLDDGIRAGGRQQPGKARGLLRFDLAGSIPAGATINSATLTLTVIATPTLPVDSTFEVHRVLAEWGEGTNVANPAVVGEASWNDRLGPGTPWSIAGGDFTATASAAQAISGNGVYNFTSAGLAADVQMWVDNAGSNFGWLLRSESETMPITIRKFGSRISLGSEPRLIIDYSTPTTIFGVALVGNQLRFSFNAQSNRTYTVEFRDSLAAGSWNSLTNLPAAPSNTTVHITNTVSSDQRYFRVATP